MVNHGAYCEVLGRDDDGDAEGGNWIRRGMDLIQKGVEQDDEPLSYSFGSAQATGRQRGRSGSVHNEPRNAPNNAMTTPGASATMNLRCPVALDEMVKAKARQDEEDLKGPSGLARMLKAFQDETSATVTAEAACSDATNKDSANRRSSLASWRQTSDDRSLSSSVDRRLFMGGGNNRRRSSILSVGSNFSNNFDSSTTSMNASGGIAAGVKQLSSAALNMLGTSPKDAPSSMMTDRRRRSSGTASLDVDSDDEEIDNQDNNGNPLEPNSKPPPRVSSIGKLLSGLCDEIINEEDTDDDEDNDDDDVKKSSHTTATAATTKDDDEQYGEEDLEARWAEPLQAGIDHLDNEQYTEAIPHFNEVLLLQREALGTDHLAVAETLNYIGITLTHVDDSYAAMVALKEALWIREHHLNEEHEDVLVTRRNLLRLYARSEEALANARVDSSGQITASASKSKAEGTGADVNAESFVLGDDDDDGDEPLHF